MAVFSYSRVAAYNPNTSPTSVARSASGSVYDIGDTGFLTPLNLTLVATNTVTTTLISDANAMFPDFTLVDRTSCVFKSGSSAMVLTTTTPVPGPTGSAGTAGKSIASAALSAGNLVLTLSDSTTLAPVPLPTGSAIDDSSAAYLIGNGTLTKAQLNATFVPKWKATTAYLAGDAVLSPAGDTVTAKVNFTSGASFNAANWNYSPTYAASLARSAAKTANYTAVANENVLCNAAGGPFTVTLPSNPADKTTVSVEKIDSANVVLITTGSGDVLYQVGSGASTMGLLIANQAQSLQFDSATRVWRPLNNHLPVEGLDARYALLSAGPKKSVRVCATTNVTISAPGATIDTIALATGDRVLLVGQTTASQNGVYVFATASTAMTRATDVDEPAETSGAIVYVNEGWAQGGHGWRNTNYPTMTVDTTTQTWVEFYSNPIPGQFATPVAYKPANYYWCSSTGSTAAVTAAADRPTASPFIVSAPLIITAMTAEVRVIGDAACVFRIGIWKDNGYGQPGTLVYDGGTVPAGTTVGVKVVAVPGGLTITLQPGLYWAGGAAQGVTSVAPQMGGIGPGSVTMPFPLGTTSPGTSQAVGGVNAGLQSGAFTDWTVNAVSGSVVRVGFLVPA